jgi:hypothetical protein
MSCRKRARKDSQVSCADPTPTSATVEATRFNGGSAEAANTQITFKKFNQFKRYDCLCIQIFHYNNTKETAPKN